MPLPAAWRARYDYQLRPLVGPMACRVLRLQGAARFSGEPLHAVYVGNGNNLSFLRELFFDASEETTLAEGIPPWGVGGALAKFGADAGLLLHELPPAWRWCAPRGAALRLPAWIGAELALPDPAGGQARALPRAVEREALRHQRREGYALEYADAVQDFRRFYAEFYRPYIATRFGDTAILVDEARFLARCRGARLARLMADGRWVAGMLALRNGAVLRLGWYAAASATPPRGASETLDALVIRDAWQDGVRRVILGNTRPCLVDGVLRYKLRLGAKLSPTRFPQPRLGITLRGAPAAALECLERQPLLGRRGDGLGVYRVDRGGAAPTVTLEAWPAG